MIYHDHVEIIVMHMIKCLSNNVERNFDNVGIISLYPRPVRRYRRGSGHRMLYLVSLDQSTLM